MAGILLLLIACQSSQKIANNWTGKSKQELMMHFGPPNRIMDDGAGGEILIYETRSNMPATVFDSTGTRPIQTSAGIVHHYRYFWVDSAKRVYHYRAKSDLIPPTPHQVQVVRF
jgi:hypothetical protein